MTYSHAQVFGTGSGWQTTGHTLTEPSLVIPISALAATWNTTPSYENAATETGVATLHRILSGPCVSNCTQAMYDADLTKNLIVAPARFDAFSVVEHTVGTVTNIEQLQTLSVQFFAPFNTSIDSNDY